MSIRDLSACRAKLQRGFQKFNVLRAEVDRALGTESVAVFCEVDSATGNRLLRAKLREPIPDSVPLEVGEIVYQLRSTLDLLVTALARANGGDGKGQMFPFAKDATDFAGKQAQGKISQLLQKDRQMIASLKPYGGGDDFLWAFGKLANQDKHIDLIPWKADMHSVADDFDISFGGIGDIGIGDASGSRLDQGATLISLGSAGEMTPRSVASSIQIGGVLVFGDGIPQFAGKSVLHVLAECGRRVETIVGTMEIV